jgi:SOS-response transcriptional repressor LexA
MDTLAKRLRFLRKERGLSQEELAELSGVEQSLISKLERGVIQRTTGLVALANALRGRPTWLDIGDGPMEAPVEETTTYLLTPGAKASNPALASMLRAGTAINLIEDVYPAEFSVPLLSWVRAGEFCEAPGNFTREDAQELLPRPLARTGPNTFALTVVGDSMDVPDGYREGEIVYIDPDIEPTPGKDVLAKADGKMTLKRYKVDDEGPYLLQLNGNRIIRPAGEWHVCGVVIFAGRRC